MVITVTNRSINPRPIRKRHRNHRSGPVLRNTVHACDHWPEQRKAVHPSLDSSNRRNWYLRIAGRGLQHARFPLRKWWQFWSWWRIITTWIRSEKLDRWASRGEMFGNSKLRPSRRVSSGKPLLQGWRGEETCEKIECRGKGYLDTVECLQEKIKSEKLGRQKWKIWSRIAGWVLY